MKKVKKIFIKGGRKNEYNLYKTRRLFNTRFKIKREKSVKLGRYAKLRLKFIKHEMKPFYQKLLMEDKLTEYLFEIEAKANEMGTNDE